jgi:hypothetical protein
MLLTAAALALALHAAPASAEPPSTSRLATTGFGVASVLHQEDADGVIVEGYLFGINVLHGAHPDVPYDRAVVFFGTRFDPALGYAVTFVGAGPAEYAAQGLNGATLTGTLEALPFYDGSNLPPDPLPPLVIDVDLRYDGFGSVHASATHYGGGSAGSAYVAYRAARWRYADVSGTATVDGAAATVDTAQLLAETSGEFNLVALPATP